MGGDEEHRESFRRELMESRGRRISVLWTCNDRLASSTGRLVEVGADFIEILGLTPTFDDSVGQFFGSCTNLDATDLEQIILIENICWVVEDVPEERKAGFPLACVAFDPPGGAGNGPTSSGS